MEYPKTSEPDRTWLWKNAASLLLVVLTTAAATALEWATWQILGGRLLFGPFYYAAIMLSGWFEGRWPALAATALGGIEALLFLSEPFDLASHPWRTAARLSLYACVGVLISLLVGGLRRALVEAANHARDAQRSEALARQTEQQFRLIVEGVADYAILMLDPQGRIVSWNPGAQRVTGYAPEDVMGMPFSMLFNAADQAAGVAEAELREAERLGSVHHDRWYARKDGTPYWGTGATSALRDEHGVLRGFVKLRRDLTEQRLAEESLRRSEDRLRMTSDAVPALIGYVDARQNLRMANLRYEEWFGRPREQILGKHLRDALGDESYDVVRPHVRIALSGHPVSFETVLRLKDGGPHHIKSSFIPDVSPRGRVRGFVVFASDITDLKAAEAERLRMLERERRWRAQVEAMQRIGQVLTAGLDEKKLAQAITDTARELIGADFGVFVCCGELSTRGEWQVVSGLEPDAAERFDASSFMPLFAPTLRGEEILRSGDLGEEPKLSWSQEPTATPAIRSYLAVPVVARSGQVLGGLFLSHQKPGVFTDREERIAAALAAQIAIAIDNVRLFEQVKRERNAADAARVAAEEASRAKDEFLAVVSHELRTPLTAILGWSRLLQDGKVDDATLNEAVDAVERNAQAQAQLVDDLLDMSRITSGRLRLDVQRVSLRHVIEAAVDAMRPAAHAREIRLDVNTNGAWGIVMGDPTRLQQIVWNLVSNAIKFTPQGGSVEVRLDRIDSQARITVRDTGKGIEPEFLAHVFDRFSQADGSTTRRHGGLGLGLAIVRHLVELHGGTVRAASDGPGKGATFTVSLPLAPGAQDDAAAAGHSERSAAQRRNHTPADLEGICVLVVDDEKDARRMMSQALESCRARVLTADSAPAALETMRATRPDVLISDIAMPGMDGYALIRKVREIDAQRDDPLPAIAVTAFARREDREKAMRAGFQKHLAKPIEPSELAGMVADLARGSDRHNRGAADAAPGEGN